MTKILALVSFLLLAMMGFNNGGAADGYDELWQKVLEYENQKKPKSALAEVEKIYKKASREKETIQLTKAVVYKSKFLLQTQEEGYDQVVDFFKAEIEKSPSPTREILLSVEATIYSQYLQHNRWKIQQRNRIDDFIENDPQTWPANTFIEKIAHNFKESIKNPEVLAEPLNTYNELLYIYDDETLVYYPTLYDLLAYRAVTFFSRNDSYLTAPVYQFSVSDEKYLSKAEEFESIEITTKDSTSLLYQGVLILQEHLKYNKDRPEARAYINLRRIDLIYNQSRLKDKNEIYLERLLELEKEYSTLSSHPEVYARLARYYNNRASRNIEDRSDDYITALEYCNKAIKEYPEAPATRECVNIYNGINSISLNLVGENAYPSEEDLLIKLDYKNLDKAYCKLVALDRKDIYRIKEDRQNKELKTIVKSKSAIREWTQELYNDGKHYNLSAELSLESLPIGSYAIMVSDIEDPFDIEGVSRIMIVSITDLSYKLLNDGLKPKVYVTHRKTGEPFKDVQVFCFENEYDHSKRKNKKKKIGKYKTDKNGLAVIDKKDIRRYHIELEKDDDYFLTQDNHYFSERGRSRGDERTIIYTDRSIYRPGQTVFFKVLRLSIDVNQIPTIIKDEEIDISFLDANGQEVSELELVTNDYGTTSGSFVIPTGGLNGQMELRESDGSTYFRVEEYKRPKFEVEALPLEDIYQLNDSVTVKVKATSFAGASIDDAQVVYRVTRGVSFPWWHWGCGYRYPSYSRNQVEIKNGTLTTDKTGKVSIKFKAVPAEGVLPKWNPLYEYAINVDITDVNGETHSVSQSVRIGQRTRLLSFTSMPNPYLSGKKDQSITLHISDLNNEEKEGSGVVEIFLLEQPEEVKNNRYWNHPDTIMLMQKDFEKKHKSYSWTDEDYKSWKTKEKVATIDFSHTGNKSIELPKLNGGLYRIVAKMNDVDGEEIKQEVYLSALNFKKKKYPTTAHLFHSLNQASYQPGDKVELKLGTPSEKLHLLYSVEKNKQIVSQEWIELKGKEEIKIPVEEIHRGGFIVHLSYIKNNRPHQQQIRINVPWTNKNLNFEFISFRDKTLPGSQEQYKIKISGPDKDKVSAEVLATMYDASLDEFTGHSWGSNFYPTYYSHYSVTIPGFNQIGSNRYRNNHYKNRLQFKGKNLIFPKLHDFGMGFHYNYDRHWGYDRRSKGSPEDFGVGGVDLENSTIDEVVVTAYKKPMMEMDNTTQGRTVTSEEIRSLPTKNISALAATSAGISTSDGDDNISIRGSRNDASNVYVDGVRVSQNAIQEEDKFANIAVRENLNETVFFYPHLETDKDGNVLISFKMNEALTKWKLMTFAHTQDLEVGMETREVVTQKDLMVVPNPPRFLRDNDEIIFTSKVNNLTDKAIEGSIKIELLDALTMQPLEGIIDSKELEQSFKIDPRQSTLAKWKMNIPEREVDAITYRVIAVSGTHSDGEENVLPVLTNRMLVTETMPLTVDPLETKSFTFSELQNAGGSVVHHNYSFEYTSNPAWYAVQAMPYIEENCSHNSPSNVFNRLYTNILASHIVNKHPRIKAVFDEWKRTDSDALISNLEKNQELKTAILKETPWVRQAMSETQQKKNIALLFDLNLIANSRRSNIAQLKNFQNPDGGFSWYGTERSNRHTSQSILEGLGHLSRLGIDVKKDTELQPIIDRLIQYCDEQIRKEYERRDKKHNHLSRIAIHYLYTRSFFKEKPLTMNADKAFEYYLYLAQAKVLDYGIYTSGMLGLALNRYDKKEAAQKITESLLERALTHPELGMYWNEGNGFNWHELPIERHSMMIELMVEMDQKEEIDDLKLWLLRNKQTNHWKTTKATAAAIYALLVEDEEGGMNKWILDAKIPSIKIGGKEMDFSDDTQAGTGYVKASYGKSEINSAIAKVEITNPNEHVGWGGIYWQYFEDMDKIKTFEKTPLKLRKSLYKKVLDDKGEKIIPVTKENLKIGDKLVVRIELESDRSMEYLHLKDMRASGLEPVSTLSGYKWSHGLGYYQSSRDLATDFFISYLPKGKYVFEYDLRVQHAGTFSNGITTIQSMYAPEYTSHSNGQIIHIE